MLINKGNALRRHDSESDGLVSRRRFIRGAALGALGVATTLGGAESALAKDVGEITLDALLVTYFSATPGAVGSSFWSLSGSYATTLLLGSVEAPELRLRPRVVSGRERVIAGYKIKQSKSEQVEDAILIQHRGFKGVNLEFGSSGVSTRDDTSFFGILRPRLQLLGGSSTQYFRILGGDAEFMITPRSYRQENLGIDQGTVDSWLSQYVTDKPSLLEPRFELKASTGLTSAGAGHEFTLKGRGDLEFSPANTAVTTARIVEQRGFFSERLKEAFAAGKHLEITHTSVQEIETGQIIKVDVSLQREARGTSEVYWDSVFKTFVVIDAGLLGDGQ